MSHGYDLGTVEGMEDACYGAELAAAEEAMEEEWDPGECPGWDLGECWSCPHEPGCPLPTEE